MLKVVSAVQVINPAPEAIVQERGGSGHAGIYVYQVSRDQRGVCDRVEVCPLSSESLRPSRTPDSFL